MRKSFVLLAVLLTVSVAGCGSGDDPPAGSPDNPAQKDGGPATRDSLDGRTFTATDADGVRITKDAPLEIAFDGPGLSVDAGCNFIGGKYSIEDGVIQALLSSTLIGCPPALAELESFVSELLQEGAEVRLSGNELTIEGKNGTSLSLED